MCSRSSGKRELGVWEWILYGPRSPPRGFQERPIVIVRVLFIYWFWFRNHNHMSCHRRISSRGGRMLPQTCWMKATQTVHQAKTEDFVTIQLNEGFHTVHIHSMHTFKENCRVEYIQLYCLIVIFISCSPLPLLFHYIYSHSPIIVDLHPTPLGIFIFLDFQPSKPFFIFSPPLP